MQYANKTYFPCVPSWDPCESHALCELCIMSLCIMRKSTVSHLLVQQLHSKGCFRQLKPTLVICIYLSFAGGNSQWLTRRLRGESQRTYILGAERPSLYTLQGVLFGTVCISLHHSIYPCTMWCISIISCIPYGFDLLLDTTHMVHHHMSLPCGATLNTWS